jgi:hypothetical protein
MKVLILLGAIVIIALVLKACVSGNTLAEDPPRPPSNLKPQVFKENNKLIVVSNVSHQDISKALTKFCNAYNKEDFAALPRLFEVKYGTYAVTFPYDVDFATYCFAVNFLKYPMDIKWNAKVRAWAITKQGDDWITEKNVNKKVMLYLEEHDKEYDNVFLTTQDNVGYKLGFAAGQETQLLSIPKERYIEPTVSYQSLQGMKFEDFK